MTLLIIDMNFQPWIDCCTTFHSFFSWKVWNFFFFLILKSWQVCDWLAKWIIMLRFMDLRWPRVFRRSNAGLVQHSGWQEMVSLCSLIRLIGVCADRDQPEFLCSRSDSRHLEVHVATAGGWLTRYRPREVRNSIYRYRKIHIDYRSKFLYRFISPISIIYGNTS